jgi:hypothetical protein
VTGEAVGEVLVLAVGVALSPLAIITVLLMLVTPGTARVAWAFAAAWALSLAIVTALALLLADGANASRNGAPASWVDVVKLVIGVLLVAFAAWEWHVHGRNGEAQPSGWLRKLESVSAPRAAGLGVAIAVFKPKNLLLTIAAGVAVAQAGASAAEQAIAVGVFAALASIGLAVPLGIYVLMPSRGPALLAGMRDWMLRESPAIIAVLCLVIAAILIGDGAVSLAS